MRRQNVRKTTGKQNPVISAIGNGEGWREGRGQKNLVLFRTGEGSARQGQGRNLAFLLRAIPHCCGLRGKGQAQASLDLGYGPWAPLRNQRPGLTLYTRGPTPSKCQCCPETNPRPPVPLYSGPGIYDKVTGTVLCSPFSPAQLMLKSRMGLYFVGNFKAKPLWRVTMYSNFRVRY